MNEHISKKLTWYIIYSIQYLHFIFHQRNLVQDQHRYEQANYYNLSYCLFFFPNTKAQRIESSKTLFFYLKKILFLISKLMFPILINPWLHTYKIKANILIWNIVRTNNKCKEFTNNIAPHNDITVPNLTQSILILKIKKYIIFIIWNYLVVKKKKFSKDIMNNYRSDSLIIQSHCTLKF